MALYLGSSEINPVETVEVIKEVPTEKDLTLMGNELRRAYCWSRQENVNGLCVIYDSYTNMFSNSFQATNVFLGINKTDYEMSADNSHGAAYNSYAVIDGKLYTVTSNTSGITLTQYGTDTDWEKVLYYNSSYKYALKNNLIYTYVNSTSTSITTGNIDFKQPGFAYNTKYGFINDGKIYYNSVLKNSNNWSCFYCYFSMYYGVGLSNNKICAYHIDNNIFKQLFDYTINDPCLFSSSGDVGTIAFAIDNVFYKYNFSSSTGTTSDGSNITFNYNIKKIINTGFYSSLYLILLNNGDVYNSDNVFIMSNVKDIMCGFGYCPIILTNDNKIYDISGNLKYDFNGEVVVNNTNYFGPYLQCFKILEDVYIKYNIFTIQYLEDINKGYHSYNDLENDVNVSNVSDYSITVNGDVYLRNGADDAIFTFVPEDLENHTFSDTDLLQAYLDAGIRQQQNNNT